MLDILILVAFTWLSVRIANTVFGFLEELFTRRSTTSEVNSQVNQGSSQIKSQSKNKQSNLASKKESSVKNDQKQLKKSPKKYTQVTGLPTIQQRQEPKQEDQQNKKQIVQKQVQLSNESNQNQKVLQQLLDFQKQKNQQLSLQVQKFKQQIQKYMLQIDQILTQLAKSNQNKQTNPGLQTSIQDDKRVVYDAQQSRIQLQKIQQYKQQITKLQRQLQQKYAGDGNNQFYEKLQIEKMTNQKLIFQIQQLSLEKQHFTMILQQSKKDKQKIKELQQKIVKLQQKSKQNSKIQSQSNKGNNIQSSINSDYQQLKAQFQVARQHQQLQQEQIRKITEQNLKTQQKLRKQIQQKQSLTQKFTQLQQQLLFAQEQIRQSAQNQSKKPSNQHIKSPPSARNSNSYIQNPSVNGSKQGSRVILHPELLKIRQKIANKDKELVHGHGYKIQLSPVTVENKYGSPIDDKKNVLRVSRQGEVRLAQREHSPTFHSIGLPESKSTTDRRKITVVPQSNSPNSNYMRPTSSIYDSYDIPHRHRTPQPDTRPAIQSSIFQGGILDEAFFSQTQILKQNQKEYILNEIRNLKKISVKKTRMTYSSIGNNDSKSISQFVANVPNVLVIVQLKNKKIVGAFTQSAFSRDVRAHFERMKPTNVLTKAMIIDITQQKSFRNNTGIDVISSDTNELVWGKREFVLQTTQPLQLSCNLNCQGAVYPCSYRNSEFLGLNGSSCSVSHFEVYRLFLG